jgi:hypothetical protein
VEYDDLHPEINLFGGNEMGNNGAERRLLFYPGSSLLQQSMPILVYNTATKIVSALSLEPDGIERRQISTRHFWNPHAKMNYIFCSDGLWVAGWYSLELNNDFFAFRLQSAGRYWADHSPPYVQLTGDRLYTAQYEYFSGIRIPYNISRKTTLKITDTDTGETVWGLTETIDSFLNLHWITENWFIKNTYWFLVGNGDGRRINTIYNYKTGKEISFAPEYIIGYGDGVVLTTTVTGTSPAEMSLTGITVWTPEKEILYRDSTFSISGIIDREGVRNSWWGWPAIYISYFDYPYIYCNIAKGLDYILPHGALIMNLNDGKTYFTPYGYHLYGIFESE